MRPGALAPDVDGYLDELPALLERHGHVGVDGFVGFVPLLGLEHVHFVSVRRARERLVAVAAAAIGAVDLRDCRRVVALAQVSNVPLVEVCHALARLLHGRVVFAGALELFQVVAGVVRRVAVGVFVDRRTSGAGVEVAQRRHDVGAPAPGAVDSAASGEAQEKQQRHRGQNHL